MVYFERIDERRFRATEHASGAWDEDMQHIAPAMGLMTHVMERDRNQRRGEDSLRIAGLHYDILGPMPVGEVEVDVRVLRPGKTIELIEVELSHDARPAVLLRGWLLAGFDTAALEGTALARIPGPEAFEPWDASSVWPGGLIRSIESRRRIVGQGHSQAWLRTPHSLLAEEPVSDLARFVGLFDIANGVAARSDPDEVIFPNVELSAQIFRAPEGEWVGCDTRVSFGPDGRGLTQTIVHDLKGPIGSSTQGLTVRPQR